MFLDPNTQRVRFALQKKQQGFLLPLGIFIIVVMASFAAVLSRNTIQTSTSAGLEIVTVQAFYAAESGAQIGMQTLFYPNPTLRQQVDSRCASMNNNIAFTQAGLENCAAVITCTCLYGDDTSCASGTAANYSSSVAPNKSSSYYSVQSVATCGQGNIRSTRTIEAGSFLQQE